MAMPWDSIDILWYIDNEREENVVKQHN